MKPESSSTVSTGGNQKRIALWVIFASILSVLLIVGGVLLIRRNPFFKSYYVPSDGMLPTLQANEIVIADLRAFGGQRLPVVNDIVVFHPPVAAITTTEFSSSELTYISRVIGVPGDIIEVREGVLFRNRVKVIEPFLQLASGSDKMEWDFKLVLRDGHFIPVLWRENELPNLDSFTAAEFRAADESEAQKLFSLPPTAIPPGYFLTMGDNRENSFDGRMWGQLPKDNLIGKIIR